MTRYVIERNHSQSAWVIRENETGKLLGTLTRRGKLYIVESPMFHAQAQATDPLHALRDVFHTTEFYSKLTGTFHKLTPENLRALVGAVIITTGK